MKALYCLSFDKKTEWIDDGVKLVEDQLGAALLTFLATDFDTFLNELVVTADDLNHPTDREKLAEAVAAKIKSQYPFLTSALLPMSFEKKKVIWLRYRLLELDKLRSDLCTLVDDVFLMDQRKESPLQRLCMRQSRDKLLAAKLAGLSDYLRVERRIYIGGQEFVPILSPAQEIKPPEDITSRLFLGSDDLQAVLLTEIQEMAQQNVRLKKCAYCGGYFQPFSSRTVYCDRLAGKAGKTCKELAAKEKYEKKIAADEGLSLYQRRNKAYAMRVSRAPAIYQDAEYQAWKQAAEAAVKQYVDGTLDLEHLTQILEIPNAKASHSR